MAKCVCQAGYEGDSDLYCSLIPVPDCQLDHDCSALQGCVDGHCVDLCQKLQPCSSGAVCQILNTKPVKALSCVCPAGYSGDPQFACIPGMFFTLPPLYSGIIKYLQHLFFSVIYIHKA